MSDEMEQLKALVRELTDVIVQTSKNHQEHLQRHEACLAEQLAAMKRLQQNQQIDHLNLSEVAGQVNAHRDILTALDAEVRRRMGEPPAETPKDVVN
jgi:hypothetical protein